MHIPVLLKEVSENLKIPEGGTLVDCTLGGGGHSLEIAKISKNILVIGLDVDSKAIERTKKKVEASSGKFVFRKTNFRNLDKVLDNEKIGLVDGILLDLGFSSDQIDTPEGEIGRGFSFNKNEPLQMTLSDEITEQTLTARDIVNKWEQKNLETIIRNYGEEKKAKKIAEIIVQARNKKPIETSEDLALIIKNAIGKNGKINPATKTFQALRITVNDELGALEEVLPKAIENLKSGGRVAIISFHSLEDRIVKNFGKQYQKMGKIRILSKKPIIATREEAKENPRARSAKLRIFEKI